MNDVLDELYVAYCELLGDLIIGYPLSEKSLSNLWSLIHKLYFVKYESHANSDVVKILEYYEYL